MVGNAIPYFIPYGNPKLRSSTTMLIVALACTDLLTTANVMPLTIDAVINSRRRFSDVCLFVFVWFVCLSVFSLEDKYRPATKTFHFDRPSAYFPRCHESWVTHLLRKGGGGEIWFLQLLTMHPILVIPFQNGGGGSWFLQLSIMHPIPVKPCRNQTWGINSQKQFSWNGNLGVSSLCVERTYLRLCVKRGPERMEWVCYIIAVYFKALNNSLSQNWL